MKNIKITYLVLIVALTVLWLLADTLLAADYEFFALRASLVNYTGIIGMAAMSVGMMLAVRPVLIEPYLGGLDKMYRLHKWLGVTGLAFSVIHWLWAKGPKWMIGWGWMERPVRHPPAEQPVAIFQFFQSQRGLAETIGEWAFYVAVVLIVLALWKRFPYRYFFKTHRLLAIVYLFLVFHSVVLMKFIYWGEVIGPVMALLMIGGTAAAFVSLFRKVGFSRRAVGVIEELVRHPDNRVLKVALALRDRWSGHEAGQFAFVTFDPSEGPHPYTISSAWNGDGKMFFLIKGIGDYTETLPDALRMGDLVTVEGPYGRFDFSGDKPRQIWVGGGIGRGSAARTGGHEGWPAERGTDLSDRAGMAIRRPLVLWAGGLRPGLARGLHRQGTLARRLPSGIVRYAVRLTARRLPRSPFPCLCNRFPLSARQISP